jgi:putative protease
MNMAKKKRKVSGAKAKKRSGKKAAKKAPKKSKKPAKRTTAKKKPARAKPSKVRAVKKATPKKRPAQTAVKKRPTPKAVAIGSLAAPLAPYIPAPNEAAVGKVTHYYSHLQVAVVHVDRGSLQVGDTIHVKGHTTDFEQTVDSMEIEHERIDRAEPGDIFGLKVRDHAREHDVVYKVQT